MAQMHGPTLFILMFAVATVAAASIRKSSSGLDARQRSMTYRLTVRDFLPAGCMRRSDYRAAWDFSGKTYNILEKYYDDLNLSPAGVTFTDPEYDLSAKRNKDEKSILSGFGYKTSNGFKNLQWDKYCPYFAAMRLGEVSGHPDFEAHSDQLGLNGPIRPDCHHGGKADGTCVGRMISGNITRGSSGVPKVEHCSANGSCSPVVRDRFASSSKTDSEMFDKWYNDDAKYNKRVGVRIELHETAARSGVFEFSRSGNREMGPEHQFFPLDDYIPIVNTTSFPAWRSAPVWPSSLSGPPVKSFRHYDGKYANTPVPKFGFTTELHTFFKYTGSEEFTFVGDDDVWVFINGRPAIDIGGVHISLERSIRLSDYADAAHLDLVEGGVYELDIFHAERRYTESNFKITTSLTDTCNVVRSGSAAFRQSSAVRSDWKFDGLDTSQGDANTGFLLTDANGNPRSSNSAFVRQPVHVGAGFITTLSFEAHVDGVHEGLSFVLHNSPGGLKNLPTSTGSGLNANYLTNALVITLDMCTDRSKGTVCNDQQIGIYYQNNSILHAKDTYASSGSYSSYYSYNSDYSWYSSEEGEDESIVGKPLKLVPENLIVFENVMRSLRVTGEKHTMRVEYYKTPDVMDVFIDDSLYLRARDLNLTAVLGGSKAYVGVTSATSSEPATLEISEFEVDAVFLDPASTDAFELDVGNASEPFVEIPADGETPGTLSVQTRDLCLGTIQSGGYAHLMKAMFVEALHPGATTYSNGSLTPLIVNASIVDNEDGTYGAQLRSTVKTSFDLWVCFGDACEIDVKLVELNANKPFELRVPNVTQIGAATEDVFFYSRPNAVRVVSVEPSPDNGPDGVDVPGFVFPAYIFVAGGVGLALMCTFITFGLVAQNKRRRWLHNQKFIEQGKLHNLEKASQACGIQACETQSWEREYNLMGKQVLDTCAEVLQVRVQHHPGLPVSSVPGLPVSSVNLATTKRELREEICTLKEDEQQRVMQCTPSRPPQRNNFESVLESTAEDDWEFTVQAV